MFREKNFASYNKGYSQFGLNILAMPSFKGLAQGSKLNADNSIIRVICV